MSDENIAVMGERGQVVIPQSLRKRLDLKSKTRFLVIGKDDTVSLKKLDLSDVRREMEELWREIDRLPGRRPRIQEIMDGVRKVRSGKRKH